MLPVSSYSRLSALKMGGLSFKVENVLIKILLNNSKIHCLYMKNKNLQKNSF